MKALIPIGCAVDLAASGIAGGAILMIIGGTLIAAAPTLGVAWGVFLAIDDRRERRATAEYNERLRLERELWEQEQRDLGYR